MLLPIDMKYLQRKQAGLLSNRLKRRHSYNFHCSKASYRPSSPFPVYPFPGLLQHSFPWKPADKGSLKALAVTVLISHQWLSSSLSSVRLTQAPSLLVQTPFFSSLLCFSPTHFLDVVTTHHLGSRDKVSSNLGLGNAQYWWSNASTNILKKCSIERIDLSSISY